MVIISENTIISSKITDASDYQEFKILNYLKLDIYRKYKKLKEVYNLNYSIHIADYQSISYTFETSLPNIYKDHHEKCNCKIKEACLIIIPIPNYITVYTNLVPEKCLIPEYEPFSLINASFGKSRVKNKVDSKPIVKKKSKCSGNSHLGELTNL